MEYSLMKKADVEAHLTDTLVGKNFNSLLLCTTIKEALEELLPSEMHRFISCTHVGQTVYISYKKSHLMAVDVHKRVSKREELFYRTILEYAYKSFTVYFTGTIGDHIAKIDEIADINAKKESERTELLLSVCGYIAQTYNITKMAEIHKLFQHFCDNYYSLYSKYPLSEQEERRAEN